MGLFDRFKRRVKEVSDEVDTEELTVEEDSIEGQQLASSKSQGQALAEADLQHNNDDVEYEIVTDEDDWEVFDDEDQGITPKIKIQTTIGKFLMMKRTTFPNNLPVKKRNVYKRNKSNLKRQKKPMRSQ